MKADRESGRRAGTLALVAALVGMGWIAGGWLHMAGPGLPAADPVPPAALDGYAAEAVATRAFTAARLAYYGGAATCADAPYVAYARSDVEADVVDAWYVALQVSADAALVARGADDYACPMHKALAYLARLWDADGGGFLPRATFDGQASPGAEKFADDNALIGLAYLDAATVSRDRATHAGYAAQARRAADYLLATHWDDTFYGGLWWSTRRAAAREGKPAQANALATALFLRLAALDGDAARGEWADRLLAWLDATLWDEAAGLYRWAIHYADPATGEGRAVSPHFFNYDQGLLIEVHLLRHRAGDPTGGALVRAQRIAAALDDAFWNERRPGYSLRSGVVWIYSAFAAWLTPPLVALYAVDGDPRWLAMAERNMAALAGAMRDPDDGGYYDYAWDCTRWTRGRDRCPESGWVLGPAKIGAAQAAVQRGFAALAEVATLPVAGATVAR